MGLGRGITTLLESSMILSNLAFLRRKNPRSLPKIVIFQEMIKAAYDTQKSPLQAEEWKEQNKTRHKTAWKCVNKNSSAHQADPGGAVPGVTPKGPPSSVP